MSITPEGAGQDVVVGLLVLFGFGCESGTVCKLSISKPVPRARKNALHADQLELACPRVPRGP